MSINWKLVAIVLIAATLRFYQLGAIPPSLDWDEVSLSYNAKALFETGRDEYGNSWPLTIRSFNDYKPALYTYALIPIFALFGTSELAIRLPSAIAGTLTVLITYFLVVELFSDRKSYVLHAIRYRLAALSGLLLAISPWHSHLSRVAFEANLGLLFFISGMYCFLKARHHPWWLVGTALSFGFALMAYHSTKIVIPLLIGIVIWPYLKIFFRAPKAVVVAGIIAVLFAALVLRTIQLGIGQARLSSVSFLTIDNLLDPSRRRIESDNFSLLSRLLNHRFLVYAKEIAGGYLDHYDFNFWFVEGDSIERLTFVTTMGLLLWWELPFLIIGLIALANQSTDSRKIVFTWFLVAPAASALTSGTPNAIRSIYFLPTFQIFIALGIITTISWVKQKKKLLYALCSILYTLLALVNVAIYFHNYYTHAPIETSPGWQYGYKQMTQWLMPRKNNYDRVIITPSYDQPYIYVLWYGNYSPKAFTNDGSFAQKLENIEFRTVNWKEDINFTNTLLIGTADEIKEPQKAIWSVNFLDGKPAFIAVESLN